MECYGLWGGWSEKKGIKIEKHYDGKMKNIIITFKIIDGTNAPGMGGWKE